MSPQPPSHSPDIARLQADGYDIAVVGGYLLARDVPYVNAARQVRRGTLVSELTLAGERTAKPSTHVVMFAGEHPCDQHGGTLNAISHQSGRRDLGSGVIVDHSFSSKPAGGYVDYHHKLTSYLNLIVGPAQAIELGATAQTFPVVDRHEDGGPFAYRDTASARICIDALNDCFRCLKIGVLGIGGTGGYIVDLVTKTPVAEVHLWDGDLFLQHNAFRAPGAASREQLVAAPNKAEHFARIYSEMHTGVVAHSEYVDETNVHALAALDFVFMATGDGAAKKLITSYLIQQNIPFVDVGLGVQESEGLLGGSVRVTSATPGFHDHLEARIPTNDTDVDVAYESNIQIADLNSLNAALAVGRWKRYVGFYRDLEREHHSIYDIDGNNITNTDQHD